MSKEKSEKGVRNVPITVRLNEGEHEKLKQCAAACGLSAAEFMRQLCKGNAPQPKPKTEFWELLNKLYEVHDAFKKCVPYYPTATEKMCIRDRAYREHETGTGHNGTAKGRKCHRVDRQNK